MSRHNRTATASPALAPGLAWYVVALTPASNYYSVMLPAMLGHRARPAALRRSASSPPASLVALMRPDLGRSSAKPAIRKDSDERVHCLPHTEGPA
jgi:hypothetical protein